MRVEPLGSSRRTGAALSFYSAAFLCLSFSLNALAAIPDALPNIVREPVRGIFLVAAKSLLDPNFSRSVVLLTEHGILGSIGLIINKTSTVSVVSILPELEGLEDENTKLRFGGPVQIRSVRLLVNAGGEIPSAQLLLPGVYFVNSTVTLQALLDDKAAVAARTINYYAGFAGWAPGQLDAEIARGDWYLIKADRATIFEYEGATLWPELMKKLEGTWVLMENATPADTPLYTTVCEYSHETT